MVYAGEANSIASGAILVQYSMPVSFGTKDVLILCVAILRRIRTIRIKQRRLMKSEGHSADFAKWMIELRDGAFQIQREFRFEAEGDCAGFAKFVGNFMKCAHMTVVTSRGSLAEPSVIVCIQILPERNLLIAAGEIAAICEHEYSPIVSHEVQSAA